MSAIKTIRQSVLEAVTKVALIPLSSVDDNKTLAQHGLSLLERLEFVMDVEDSLGFDIPDSDAARLETLPVREYILYAEARRSALTV